MKVQAIIMVKDGKDFIKDVIESCKGLCDRVMVFDTGSSDNTISIVSKIKGIKIIIKKIKFQGFSITRNKCFDLSYDKNYTWNIVLDDSYIITQSIFLRDELKNIKKNHHCLSIYIARGTMVYKSCRITRTQNKTIRYTGDLHETINYNTDYVIQSSVIEDATNDTHKQRTVDREIYDIKMLKNKLDSRSLFYYAGALLKQFNKGECSKEDCIQGFMNRINCKSDNHEETYMACMLLAHIYGQENDNENAVRYYMYAADKFPPRSGEAYMSAYLLTDIVFFLDRAYANRFSSEFNIGCDLSIYDKNGLIEQQYNLFYNHL